ncbi:DUF2624 family protein [Lentibacillus cibarius]|uniref:DUF2624 domain-containing protein n=1 Tax=Lentibacillus cibarius TaxID=2583219 RepID=A0A549YLG1_9BACI|nr:DUF2624 domain-containing protein [Lentibacillus cibarius]TMN20982.1 DUF2624 domain-containing protein [Lentibacillus cibarius]TRM12722.1 DUF2624 family protein [Lentibacillus cibarius]
MSAFIKQLVTNKLKQLSSDELLYYAHEYNFSITRKQANAITTYLQSHSIDPFSSDDRSKMFRELARITDRDTANKAQLLFQETIKAYGLEYLFN